jgi:hypothetical protein
VPTPVPNPGDGIVAEQQLIFLVLLQEQGSSLNDPHICFAVPATTEPVTGWQSCDSFNPVLATIDALFPELDGAAVYVVRQAVTHDHTG